MPTFNTPEPISVRIDLPDGDFTIIAGDRTDTVVDVRPGEDEEEAPPLRIEYESGRLVVRAARQEPETSRQTAAAGARQHSWVLSGLARLLGSCGESARVTIELPSGSHVQGESANGGFRCTGRLGECRLRTDHGDIRLDQAAAVHLTSDSGEITVGRATGHAEIRTDSGEIRIDEIDGSASIRSDDGECYVGEVTGTLRLIGANADMHVNRAHGSVEAKNVDGGVRIGEVARGTVVLTSTSGELEVGIRPGTAALLDVSTADGRLRNSLDAYDGPDGFGETVEIRARSHDGDIVIRRA
ncbi:DUF4097 family beta strand repeat-containing protein [Nonomuraea zeae]|uniref:DUF4097 domain-containing protein n=1 Tax=Nonomuraea zeae TaxID=1642303 RepID=A0A5S4GMY8_9ACTN|nr:DUF4097 family beta strand repeat-containing protein [Nonomuraea zeae]TMR34306.1 DUF4097 domain-containing protein [Nonomuraea zeae]